MADLIALAEAGPEDGTEGKAFLFNALARGWANGDLDEDDAREILDAVLPWRSGQKASSVTLAGSA